MVGSYIQVTTARILPTAHKKIRSAKPHDDVLEYLVLGRYYHSIRIPIQGFLSFGGANICALLMLMTIELVLWAP